MKDVDVTCALISIGGKTLVVQRSEQMKLPLKWEFPGGKIEPNESEEESIKREICEELNIEIELIKMLKPSCYEYGDISIRLIPFVANYLKGEIKLKEHRQYLLLSKGELSDLDWAEADISIMNEYISL